MNRRAYRLFIFLLMLGGPRATLNAQSASTFAKAGVAPAAPGSAPLLKDIDPKLVKAVSAFGPLFSASILRSSSEIEAPGDFVEKFQAPDGSDVRVLVKRPHPAQPEKVLRVAPMSRGQTANAYFNDAIKEAVSGGYATVIFPTGTYNFETPAAKESHVMIQGAKDLTIEGQGSTLNFASPLTGGILIIKSQRAILKGFNLDWPNTLMASVATIVSVDKQHQTMRFKIAPQYKVDASTPIVALTPWDPKSDAANPHFSLTNFYKEEYVNKTRTVYVGNNMFEVPYWNTYIAPGDVMLVRHWGGKPWRSAIEANSSSDLDFENVNVYASPYLGFSLSGGNSYRLSHCSVTRLTSARLLSTSADAVHIADSGGDIIIEDSTFAYQGDDGLNIHGAFGKFDREPDHSLHWKATGEDSWAPYGWATNADVIGMFDNTVGFVGTTTLSSLSHSSVGLGIHLKEEPPAAATEIVDLSRSGARFVIRNNRYLYNRPRGILLESSLGLVEKNVFIGQTGHGIVVGVCPGEEGPGAQNVLFRENTFTKVGSFPPAGIQSDDVRLGALVVAVQDGLENQNSMKPVFESLIFEGNIFNNLQGPGLYLSRANAVAVVNNRLTNTDLSKGDGRQSAAGLNGSIVISHTRNVSHVGNSMDHAGSMWIDPKSTSGITAISPR